MPYYFDDVDEPNSDTDWDQIEKIWQIIKNDLMDVHFETCEEALSQKYRKPTIAKTLKNSISGALRL